MTRYLLDTNVLSELVRATPEASVLAFVAPLASKSLHLSVISRFEIDRGLALIPVGRRRELYAERYEALVSGLGGGAADPVRRAPPARRGHARVTTDGVP